MRRHRHDFFDTLEAGSSTAPFPIADMMVSMIPTSGQPWTRMSVEKVQKVDHRPVTFAALAFRASPYRGRNAISMVGGLYRTRDSLASAAR